MSQINLYKVEKQMLTEADRRKEKIMTADKELFFVFLLTKGKDCDKIYGVGALAQLGAHNTGSVGVRGSNPLCSTKNSSLRCNEEFFIQADRLGISSSSQGLRRELVYHHAPRRVYHQPQSGCMKTRPQALFSVGLMIYSPSD